MNASHGYLTEPEWFTDQAHSTRWARTKTALYNIAAIISLCLFVSAVAVVAMVISDLVG